MSDSSSTPSVVVVTGANGFVGARVCRALVERGAAVRAIVRRAGTAPATRGVEEIVGDFADPDLAASVLAGATAVVTTVYPMTSDDRRAQHQVAVDGTTAFARAAVAAGVDRFVHVSTAAVYDRGPGVGDVGEDAALVGDDANDYAVTKRDTDASLGDVAGITGVLVRPPAILGAGETSVWNTVRPAAIRDDASARHAVPEQTFAWVHVDDLVALLADVATGAVATSEDPARGPVEGAWTAVNVAAGPATVRDYQVCVTDALGVEPVWDETPAWNGRIRSDRARGWGWAPRTELADALAEVAAGLRPAR